MNKISIIVALLFTFNFCHSQFLTISGFVYDSQSYERLIYATATELKSNYSCSTNDQGFFSIKIKKGLTNIRVSFVGYNSDTFLLNLSKDTLLICYLKSNSNIEEVTITNQESRISHNGSTVQAKLLSKLPVLVGEPDMMKSLQLLPGIQSVSEGQSGFSVKGGDDYQNLLLVDGVPVYNSNHLFGFFSIFNEHAVQDITMYKGDFPARYGGRLSSVIDIQTKEGNAKHIAGSASLGLLAASFDLEGPIIKDKTTFFISGRQSYLNMMATPIIKYFSGYETASYGFYDYNAKITHRFNNKNKLIFSMYRSHDSGKTESNNYSASYAKNVESTSWGNFINSLTWSHVINSKLIMSSMIHYSKYDYLSNNSFVQNVQTNYNLAENNYQTNIYDEGANININWYHSSVFTMKTGMAYTFQKYIPGVESSYSTNYTDTGIPYQIENTSGGKLNKTHELSLYSDNDIYISKPFLLHLGLRYTIYKNTISYNKLEPRINLEYFLGKAKFNISYTLAHQYNHMLSSSRISHATDLWVPSTSSIGPEFSNQISLNGEYKLSNALTVSSELYYKKSNNLVSYKDGASYLSSSSWEDMVTQGNGTSKGISLTIEKKYGVTTGWVTYTLSKTQRQFTEINDGNSFPFDYDHRHDFKFVLLHKFSNRFDVGCIWTYHSGNFISYGNIMSEGLEIDIKRNSYQLPVYHRLDVNINYHIKWHKLEQVLTFGVYNLYNQKNIYNIEYEYNTANWTSPTPLPMYLVQKKTLFPIIPSLTYRIIFN